jgi:hypothetical protein
MKISASNITVNANLYQVQYLAEIDRLFTCQTVETMFANKLVAVMERYHIHQTVAGRDVYDIHHFFINRYTYHAPVILERTGLAPKVYFEKLIQFIKDQVTQTVINQDLKTLMPYKQFQQVRKILIPERLP